MTPPTLAERRPEVVTRDVPVPTPGWIDIATSADHKQVAKLWMGTSLTFAAVAVVLFALTRVQLIVPDSTIIVPEVFSRILSATTLTAIVLFAVPLVIGLIGYVVPLQIGARSIALPRLNQLGYWLYAAGAFFVYASFLYTVPETALSPLPPLSDDVFSPSHGVDAWIGGVGLATLGFVCFAISMVATLRNMRAPGLAWRRAPVFTWAAGAISYVLLVAGPALLAALTMLTVDRHFSGVFFDPGEEGEPLLFSHLSWIFFTGCHTILVVAALGVISEIVPTFSRKPLFSHAAAAGSVAAVGALGVLAWMQNMYAAPIPDGFAFMAMAAAVALLVPIGLLYFNWLETMWDGAISLRIPLVYALAAAIALAIGLAGELAASVIPVGLQLENTVAAQQDTIMVIAGFTLAAFAGLHYWLPKVTGRSVAEGPARAALGLILGGAIVYAFAMFFAGLEGQPVDIFRYYEDDGVATENLFASLGAFALAAGVLIELGNLAASFNGGRPVGHDPWGGSTLEWFALSPPPPHNFDVVPDVRSAEPMRDIREAIRNREDAYVPPEPLERAAPPPAETVAAAVGAAEPEAEAEAESEPEAPAEAESESEAPAEPEPEDPGPPVS
jgi:heme/copper-type cytochrome/quinol oxidase subunit 1